MGALLGEHGGRAPLLGALKVMKGRLWGWASLFMGAQLGNQEWAHLPGTLRGRYRRLWRRASLSSGAHFWGTCGFVDRAYREGSEDEHLSLWGLSLANWSGFIYRGL